MKHFSFSRYTEQLGAMFAIAWGIWALSFDSFHTVKAYTGLAEYVPIELVAWFFILVGICVLILSHRNRKRHYFHLTLFAAWLLIALSFLFNDTHNTGFIVYLSVSLHHAGGYWYQVSVRQWNRNLRSSE